MQTNCGTPPLSLGELIATGYDAGGRQKAEAVVRPVANLSGPENDHGWMPPARNRTHAGQLSELQKGRLCAEPAGTFTKQPC